MTEANEEGPLLYLVAQEPEPGYEQTFRRWYDDEHIPELLACPGFRSAQRYELVDGRGEPPTLIAVYEVDGPAAFASDEYRAQAERAAEDMTPLAREAIGHRILHFAGKYRPLSS